MSNIFHSTSYEPSSHETRSPASELRRRYPSIEKRPLSEQTEEDRRMRWIILKAQELYTSHEEHQKPGNFAQMTGRRLVAHAEMMSNVLNHIKDIHPIVSAATVPFRLVLNMALGHHDKDKRVEVLILAMIDMMLPLMELSKIKPESHREAGGKALAESLNSALLAAKYHIEGCGNLIDSYTKAGCLSRAFKIMEWTEKFKDMIDDFQNGKTNIQLALDIRTTLAVDALNAKMVKMGHILDQLMQWCKTSPNADEQNIFTNMGRHGPSAFLENERDFIHIYKKVAPGGPTRQLSIGMSAETRLSADNERVWEAKEQWKKLQKPISAILEENLTIFAGKLTVLKRDLMDVVQTSERNIINALSEGPHSYVKHPEIQELWKAMHWRLSVKTRHFVMALHDHYLHGSYAASQARVPSTLDLNSASVARFQAPPIDTADQWCLEYLRIQHLPAICEAFDDDGSGFIKISEVNVFTDSIPKNWNLLKWIAYWTGFWPTEMWEYAHRIQETMVQIADAQRNVKPVNIEYVNDYINGDGLTWIRAFTASIKSPENTSGNLELDRLVAEHRSQTEKRIHERLENLDYFIDQPDFVQFLDPLSVHNERIIQKSSRIERFVLPLLHLLLLRHLEVVRFANKYALDPREMSSADTSLKSVTANVLQRAGELRESFRQQRLDTKEQFDNVACGLYSRFQHVDAARMTFEEIGLAPQNNDLTGDDFEGSEYDQPDLPPEARGPWLDGSEGFIRSEPTFGTLVHVKGLEDYKPEHEHESAILHCDIDLSLLDITPLIGVDNLANPKTTPLAKEKTSNTATTDPSVLLGAWHIYFPCDDCKSEDSENLKKRFSCPNIGQFTRPERLTPEADPTRYGPFHPDTSLYEQPSTPPENTVPWRPLGVQFSQVGPRETFGVAIERVIEHIQLSSPRMTWGYLRRRRSIRVKWVQHLSRFKDEPRTSIDEQVLENLRLQITPADVAYFNSLVGLERRMTATHSLFYCSGCKTDIVGKMFHCLDCSVGSFSLCNDCENSQGSRRDVAQHPSSHTMMQLNYSVKWGPFTSLRTRARKEMIRHFKKQCPCSNTEGSSSSHGTPTLYCNGCWKEMRNEVHFRCVQCPDYNICESCEGDLEHRPAYDLPKDHEQPKSRRHCVAHVLLKLKAPFLEPELHELEENTGNLQSAKAQLTRLTQRIGNLETNFGIRSDDMQSSQKSYDSRLDTRQERLDDRLEALSARLDEMEKGFDSRFRTFDSRLEELHKSSTHLVMLLELAGTRAYLYGSTRSPNVEL